MCIPMLMPMIPTWNEKPPTLYSILESIVNFDKEDKTKIKDLAKNGRGTIFNFTYPLSTNVVKEDFECMILNHFIMRRIGFDTVTAFRIQLNVKLNEIMPVYNKMFDMLEGWDIFNDGERVTRELTDSRNITTTTESTSDNTSNTSTNNTTNTTTNDTSNTSTNNTTNTTTNDTSNTSTRNNTNTSEDNISSSDTTSGNTLSNTSTTTGQNISDNRNSDTPQNRLSEVRSGEYVDDYQYKQDNSTSTDTSTSTGSSTSSTDTTNNTTSETNSQTTSSVEGHTTTNVEGHTTTNVEGNTTTNVEGNTTTNVEGHTTSSVEGNTTTNVEGNTTTNSKNDTENTGNTRETIIRSPADKLKLYQDFIENRQNIYTMIFKDLEDLFFQLV